MFERFAKQDELKRAAEKKSQESETDVFKKAAEEARKEEISAEESAADVPMAES